MKKLLTKAEAERLRKFIATHDGEVKAGALIGVRHETLSRTVNRRTAPSPMLRDKLIEHKIIQSPQEVKN